MKLGDLLKKEALIPNLKAHDKKSILAEFSDHVTQINSDLDLDKDTVLQILLNREQLGSTAVGNGVAIPHGKVPGLDNIIALFGRSEQGVDFQAHDDKPTQLFFVLLAPESAIGNHLQALARLSRLLKDNHIREKLIQCPQEELYHFLISEDEKL